MDEKRERNEIVGTVTAVIFRNEENGYTVLRLDTDAVGEVTVVGCIPGITPGETLEAEGRWMKHATYGEQFKVETLRRRMPVGRRPYLITWPRGLLRALEHVPQSSLWMNLANGLWKSLSSSRSC